jgi:signal transduction histidine kinase
MHKRKIRNFLIKRPMQLRITLGFVGLALAAVIIGELLVYQVFWPLINALPRDTAMIIRPQLFTIVFWYSIPLILLIILGGIVITHRFAGPVYQIERKLDKLLQGEPIELIHLRKGDELKELAEKINAVLLKFQELQKADNSQK